MNDGLPTDDVTLDSLVLCPECGGLGYVEWWNGFVCGTELCERCEGDGDVPLHWTMDGVA